MDALVVGKIVFRVGEWMMVALKYVSEEIVLSASIAQSVEHSLSKRKVGSSILP